MPPITLSPDSEAPRETEITDAVDGDSPSREGVAWPGLAAEIALPLAVDLDGTLIVTDSLHESLLLAAGRHPFRLAALLPHALGNRAAFKRRLLALARPNPELLRYDERVLKLLRQEAGRGRRLILATGADEHIAQAVADHLGLFSDVFASDGTTNLTGLKKARRLDAELGRGRWLYAGNSRQDLHVWPASAGAVVVNGRPGLADTVRAGSIPVLGELPPAKADGKTWLQLLRLHQWSKNLLILVPLILAHKFADWERWEMALLGLLAFGCAASATYILNDLLDIEADRRHPKKRHRALASGRVEIKTGAGLMALLTLATALLLAPLPVMARWALLAYVVVTTAYSVRLKTLLSLDVVTLAMCYVLRLVFGSFATGISLSVWTLASAGFFFTSLAFAKRLIELRSHPAMENPGERKRRAYQADDSVQVGAQAAASGFLSVFVVALYINSAEVRLLYVRPDLLWLLCPVLIWWISRILVLANRATIAHDPVAFALKDRGSWCALGLLVAVLLVAK
jgi:4-hydroxybenzoate polyprenyltransferase